MRICLALSGKERGRGPHSPLLVAAAEDEVSSAAAPFANYGREYW